MQAQTASLSENISMSSTHLLAPPDHAVFAVSQPESSDDQEDEDMDVPEILEQIIEMLLSGLRDTVRLVGEILLLGWQLEVVTSQLIEVDDNMIIWVKIRCYAPSWSD